MKWDERVWAIRGSKPTEHTYRHVRRRSSNTSSAACARKWKRGRSRSGTYDSRKRSSFWLWVLDWGGDAAVSRQDGCVGARMWGPSETLVTCLLPHDRDAGDHSCQCCSVGLVPVTLVVGMRAVGGGRELDRQRRTQRPLAFHVSASAEVKRARRGTHTRSRCPHNSTPSTIFRADRSTTILNLETDIDVD